MKDFYTEQKLLLHRFVSNKLNDDEANQIKGMLKQFLQGLVDEVIAEEITTALAMHEHCRAILEQIWPDAPTSKHVPSLGNEAALRLEHNVNREIQRLRRMRSNRLNRPFIQGISARSAFMSGGIRPLPIRKQRHIKIDPKQTTHSKN